MADSPPIKLQKLNNWASTQHSHGADQTEEYFLGNLGKKITSGWFCGQ